MELKKKISIRLSEMDLKEIVADYMTRHGYEASIEDVDIVVAFEWVGYGPMEHQVARFKECVVTPKMGG